MNKWWFILILSLSCPIFGQKNSLRFLHGNIRGFIKKTGTTVFYPHDISVIVDLNSSQTNMELMFLDKNNTTNRFFIELTTKQRKDVFLAIAKYKDWHDTATTRRFRLDKLIDRATSSFISWRKPNASVVFSRNNVPFKLVFFSQNLKEHQFVFVFPSVHDKKAKVSIKPPAIYLDYKEAIKLAGLFSEKAIDDAISRENLKNRVFQ
ncbi:MAG: hypothetical protein ACRCY4_02870 [Brevinema sp.]